MATTLDSLTYDLISIVRAGLAANSEPISEELIHFWIDNTRAKLIKQDLDKRRTINPDIVQTLCIDMELTDATTCPCEIAGCTILRSVQEIPEAIELNYRNLIVSVGPIVLTKPRFSLLDYHRAMYYNPNKFSNSIPGVFLYNKRFYVVAADSKIDMLEVITAEMVLERPEEAQRFFCSGTACFSSSTTKYPLSAFMIEDMKAMIINNNFKIAASAPSDKSGDQSHELQSNTQK